MLVAAETGERIAAAGAAHAVGIRGAPLQAGAHAFAGQVSRATVRRAQAGQHAGQEGAVFLQDFVGRDVGRGQAALGDGELRARKARRHLGHGRIALAAMCDQQVQPRFAQRGDARGASLRIGIGDPFDPQRLAGALGAARALDRGFVEAASARMAKQRQHAAGAHRLAPVARTTGSQAWAWRRTKSVNSAGTCRPARSPGPPVSRARPARAARPSTRRAAAGAPRRAGPPGRTGR